MLIDPKVQKAIDEGIKEAGNKVKDIVSKAPGTSSSSSSSSSKSGNASNPAEPKDPSKNKQEYKEPISGSGKEKANDIPSWVKGKKPYKGESGKDFSKRVMDEKYGPDNYKKGADSEFSKIQKWGDRAFK